jgi:hypothetical protein
MKKKQERINDLRRISVVQLVSKRFLVIEKLLDDLRFVIIFEIIFCLRTNPVTHNLKNEIHVRLAALFHDILLQITQ